MLNEYRNTPVVKVWREMEATFGRRNAATG